MLDGHVAPSRVVDTSGFQDAGHGFVPVIIPVSDVPEERAAMLFVAMPQQRQCDNTERGIALSAVSSPDSCKAQYRLSRIESKLISNVGKRRTTKF